MTQRELEIAVPLRPIPNNGDEFHAIMVESGGMWLVIRLRRILEDLYARVDPDELLRIWNDEYDILGENTRQGPTWITVPHTFENFKCGAYFELSNWRCSPRILSH
jgi:hypothetical protein